MAKKKKVETVKPYVRRKDLSYDNIMKATSPYEQYIQEAAKTYNFDPDSIRAHIFQESTGNTKLPKGLMQITPIALAQLEQLKYNLSGYDNKDPRSNIMAGTRLLSYYRDLEAKNSKQDPNSLDVVKAYTRQYNGDKDGTKYYWERINDAYNTIKNKNGE